LTRPSGDATDRDGVAPQCRWNPVHPPPENASHEVAIEQGHLVRKPGARQFVVQAHHRRAQIEVAHCPTMASYHAGMSGRATRNDDREPHPLLQWVDGGELPRLPARPCTYLPGRTARERGFLADRLDGELYHDLMDRGFRRSGELFYATDCGACRECIPLRVPVAEFAPSRSQRRTLRKNRDVDVQVRAPQFATSTFALYRRFLAHRYPEQAAAEDAAQFRESLYRAVVDTREVVYSLQGETIAISLVDVCSRSVSAVYHFYEPAHRGRSLGVFSVLAEIEWARSIGVPWYYLGYWVEGSRAMRYKSDYRPHEVLRSGHWQRVDER